MNNTSPHTPVDLEAIEPGGIIHLSGIGGSAMRGLALLLSRRGYKVRGTDPALPRDLEQRFAEEGITATRTQDGSAVAENTRLLVATAAVPRDHLEIVRAASLGIPIVKYAQMLAGLFNPAQGIAVAGTHGKTTTSAMIATILTDAGLDPSYIIGATLPRYGAGANAGDSDVFVVEACEYDRSFLNLSPKRAVLTNIERDHLDIYSNLEEIEAAFTQFVSGVSTDGLIVYNRECPVSTRVSSGTNKRTVSFGLDDQADLRATDVSIKGEIFSFTLARGKEPLTRIGLRQPGKHNILNALAASAVALDMAVDPALIAESLGTFTGLSRRFESKGEVAGVAVLDDYAHHPTEVAALVEGMISLFPDRRKIVIFQPHQISRTKIFFDEFTRAFEGADMVLISDVFAAREEVTADTSRLARAMAEGIAKTGVIARYSGDLQGTIELAVSIAEAGDAIVTAGAGDIGTASTSILQRLK